MALVGGTNLPVAFVMARPTPDATPPECHLGPLPLAQWWVLIVRPDSDNTVENFEFLFACGSAMSAFAAPVAQLTDFDWNAIVSVCSSAASTAQPFVQLQLSLSPPSSSLLPVAGRPPPKQIRVELTPSELDRLIADVDAAAAAAAAAASLTV